MTLGVPLEFGGPISFKVSMGFFLAIDQGTTSSRAFVYNDKFEVVGRGQKTFPLYYPNPGWVEQDLREIWESVSESIRQALKNVSETGFEPSKIQAIGITNQRETFGLWERSTGEPIARAIVWQCNRSEQFCQKLARTREGRKLEKITGLKISPYFSGTKLNHFFQHNPELYERARAGKVVFGNMDTFLLSRLTAGTTHATDASNASRTLLFDLHKGAWSEYALKALKIPRQILPEVKDSDALFGHTAGLEFLPDGIPIHGVLGDQQSALFGQECFKNGQAKITYGTGAFMLINTGAHIRKTKEGVSTVAWSIRGRRTYAVESSVFIAGAAVQFLRDNFQFIKDSREIEPLARSVKDSEGVFFIPALTGLGSPHWKPFARGLLGGLSRATTKAHVARACLEGIALSVAEAFGALAKSARTRIKSVRVDGGASQNELMMQFQSDILGVSLERPKDVESTVRGAAYVAALGVGATTLEELSSKEPLEKVFAPKMTGAQSKALLQVWRRRVKALIQGAF